MQRDTVLTINVVEPALVRAVKLHSKSLGRELQGLVLVDKSYADHHARPKDETQLFKEIVCDFDNPAELQAILKRYTDRLLAVTCRYEETLQPFRKIIPFIPYLHTPTTESLLWSTEKPLMRQRLHAYNPRLVPRYQYMEREHLDQLESLVENFTYPVIVKPSGLAKSLLVTPCYSLEELRARLNFTFQIIKEVYDRDRYPGKPAVLIEEMMQGEMYSVDAYVMHDGRITCLPPTKVVTAHNVGLTGFYGYVRRMPTELPTEEIEAAYETARAAIRALNLRSTTTHTEMYRTATGWKVIEIAARIGGYREILYREVYGIEHFYNDILVRMGQQPVISTKPLAHAAALNIYAEQEGTISEIEGIDQASQLPSVIHVAAYAKPGDKALFSTNGGDLIVDAILRNRDQEQLEHDIKAVRRLIKIHVDEVH